MAPFAVERPFHNTQIQKCTTPLQPLGWEANCNCLPESYIPRKTRIANMNRQVIDPQYWNIASNMSDRRGSASEEPRASKNGTFWFGLDRPVQAPRPRLWSESLEPRNFDRSYSEFIFFLPKQQPLSTSAASLVAGSTQE